MVWILTKEILFCRGPLNNIWGGAKIFFADPQKDFFFRLHHTPQMINVRPGQPLTLGGGSRGQCEGVSSLVAIVTDCNYMHYRDLIREIVQLM